MTSCWCARRQRRVAAGAHPGRWAGRSAGGARAPGKTLLETPDMRNERRILETEELMRQRSTLPPEAVADWPAPTGPIPSICSMSACARGRKPLGRARSRDDGPPFAGLKLRPGRKFDARAFPKPSARRSRRISEAQAESAPPARYARREWLETIPNAISAISVKTISTVPTLRSARSGPGRPPKRPTLAAIATGRPAARRQRRYVLRFEPASCRGQGLLVAHPVRGDPEGRAFFQRTMRLALCHRRSHQRAAATTPMASVEICVQQ